MTSRLPRLCTAALCSAVVFAACTTTRRTPFADADYPGTLLPVASFSHDVVWQQRVTAAWGMARGERHERGFDAAIQKLGDTLTVLGISPLGNVGFTFLRRDSTPGIEVKNTSGEELPFPARFVMLDVQRVFWPWLGAPLANGQRSGVVGDEDVVETWQDGRLVLRVFARRDAVPPGSISVVYDWTGIDDATRLAPKRATLRNGWFDYELAVDTHAEAKLAPETR